MLFWFFMGAAAPLTTAPEPITGRAAYDETIVAVSATAVILSAANVLTAQATGRTTNLTGIFDPEIFDGAIFDVVRVSAPPFIAIKG